jgi:hypothetical protein
MHVKAAPLRSGQEGQIRYAWANKLRGLRGDIEALVEPSEYLATSFLGEYSAF